MTPLRAAVLDLGSNSVKFLLGEQRGATLAIHREQAFTTRLGANLSLTGRLSRQSMADTLQVLREARRDMDACGAEKLVAVGTSALRSATNAPRFLQMARDILDQPIRVISGKKEGELVYAGISSSPAWSRKEVVAMDLGGGSLEFVLGQAGAIEYCRSLPVGCVRIRDLFLKDQPVSAKQLEKARAYLHTKLAPVIRRLHGRKPAYIGSGGTMVTLAAFHRHPDRMADPQALEGTFLSAGQVRQCLNRLASFTLDEIRAFPSIPPSRADVITTGALVYDTVLNLSGATRIGCATLGLRYGVWQKWIAPRPFRRIEYRQSP